MDIQELEKAVQKNDLKAVSQIMGREIMKLRDERSGNQGRVGSK